MDNNDEKLKSLLSEVFLVNPDEFRWELERREVASWDSLGTVALSTGVEETFGYQCTPDEALSLGSFADVRSLLSDRGIAFASCG